MVAGMPQRTAKGLSPLLVPRRGIPLIFALALVLVLALVSGCKAKPGGRCSASQTACEDAHTGLFCLEGKFTEMSCAGPDGCVASGKQVDCDNTIANKGDG